MPKYLMYALAILTFWGCKPETPPVVTIEPRIPDKYLGQKNCHLQSTWDSTSISQRLMGAWRWRYQMSESLLPGGSMDVRKGLKIKFINDSIVEIYKSENLYQITKWVVTPSLTDTAMYELQIYPEAEYLRGYIWFCGGKLAFSNLHTAGGEENYYERVAY